MSDKYDILEDLVKRLNYKNVNNLSRQIVRLSDKGEKVIKNQNITKPMLRQARNYLRGVERSSQQRVLSTNSTTSSLRVKPKPKPKPKVPVKVPVKIPIKLPPKIPIKLPPKPPVKPVIKPPVKPVIKPPVKPVIKIPVKKK